MPKLTALALLALTAGPLAAAGSHPFDVHDLVMLARVSAPELSPDGKQVLYQLRETDFAANKGINSLWVLSLGAHAAPLRITDAAVNATDGHWSSDGKAVFYLAKGGEAMQVWRRASDATSPAVQVTALALDVNTYRVAPDGQHLLLSIDTFADCADLACSQHRLEAAAASKTSGHVYEQLFIRHWDTWADGRRSQLYLATLGADGRASGEPRWLTRGIDGDIPSKPFGDAAEFNFSPDGRTVYFDVRIAGRTEPWSTNFDVYSVPADGSAAPRNLTASNPAWDATPVPSADGRTLYYRAMKRAGFEADRFAVMALDLASGRTRELDPNWDRSADGLRLAGDGRTLLVTADDGGQHALFSLDVASGAVRRLTHEGSVQEFDVHAGQVVFTRSTLEQPADLYRTDLHGGAPLALSAVNAARLAGVGLGHAESFTFQGAGGASVQGWVVRPVDFDPARKYPVAFLVHGGPQGAWGDDWSYRWNPQTYAGQGFAVVMINFHGSTGFGQAFTDSISRDWGGKPLEDLKAGWHAALERYGFLDGSRACALGASYGGYMIYWMAGNWPGPWKCLVDHDGVFDVRFMAYSTEELWFSEWENGGTPWDQPANYERFNPVDHVADWKVPMLVIHSEKDFRVPFEQGIAAFTALQRRGIPSELLTFPDENHWVLKPQNSVLWHETVNAWLKRWTAP